MEGRSFRRLLMTNRRRRGRCHRCPLCVPPPIPELLGNQSLQVRVKQSTNPITETPPCSTDHRGADIISPILQRIARTRNDASCGPMYIASFYIRREGYSPLWQRRLEADMRYLGSTQCLLHELHTVLVETVPTRPARREVFYCFAHAACSTSTDHMKKMIRRSLDRDQHINDLAFPIYSSLSNLEQLIYYYGVEMSR